MDHDDLIELQHVLKAMPPVQAMRIAVVAVTDDHLRLRAPLDANLNDKGCAFGGSLASIMTLAGWALCWSRCRQAAWAVDIYVADSRIEYLQPLTEDLQAEAWLESDADWATLLRSGRERGRCRAVLHAQVLNTSGDVVCRMQSRYALIATKN